MTTEEMNDLMREVNAANERGDRQAAEKANEKLARRHDGDTMTAAEDAPDLGEAALAAAEEWDLAHQALRDTMFHFWPEMHARMGTLIRAAVAVEITEEMQRDD